MEQCLAVSQQPLTPLVLWHRRGVSKCQASLSHVPPTPESATVLQNFQPRHGALSMALTPLSPQPKAGRGKQALDSSGLQPWPVAHGHASKIKLLPNTFASGLLLGNLLGNLQRAIVSITPSPWLLGHLNHHSFGNWNKPAAKRSWPLPAVPLSGLCESLCDSESMWLYSGPVAIGAQPTPSFNSPVRLVLRGQRQHSSCQSPAQRQGAGPFPQTGLINSRNHWLLILSALRPPPMLRGLPKLCNAFCHQHNQAPYPAPHQHPAS